MEQTTIDTRITTILTEKTEDRTVDVVTYKDPESRMVWTVRPDTGAEVTRRAMSRDELQLSLPKVPLTAKPEIPQRPGQRLTITDAAGIDDEDLRQIRNHASTLGAVYYVDESGDLVVEPLPHGTRAEKLVELMESLNLEFGLQDNDLVTADDDGTDMREPPEPASSDDDDADAKPTTGDMFAPTPDRTPLARKKTKAKKGKGRRR
jgi:hypothetical protein